MWESSVDSALRNFFRVLDFRRGMALESQQSIIAHHAAAVVSDLDELLAAGFNLNPDAGCARIERIFDQLLGHRSRTLHHFAGGDLVGNVFGKNVNSAHEGCVESVSQIKGWGSKARTGESRQ